MIHHAGVQERADRSRPEGALLHCLKLTEPELVLFDDERADLFASLATSLKDTSFFCWSELKSVKGTVQVSSNSLYPDHKELTLIRSHSQT